MAQIFLVALGLLAYANSFQGAFLLDDQITLLENEAVRSLALPWAFWDQVRRPVFFLTMALNYAVGRDNPWSYHLVNLLIHLWAAQVLFSIAGRVGRFMAPSWSPKERVLCAFWLAALWVVHPLTTQSVTYITQRAESLMGLFFLLGFYAALRYWERPARRWVWCAGVAALFSVLTKEVGVTLPVVILLFDRVRAGGSWAAVWRRSRALYLALGVSWLVIFYLGLTVHPREAVPSAGFAYAKIAPWQYLLTQPEIILHYLRLVVWPAPLIFDYEWPAVRHFGQAFPPLAVIVGLMAALVVAWPRRAWLGFLGASFFVILAPSSSLIPLRDLAFEHRMYLPMIFVLAALVLAVGKIGTWAVRSAGMRQNGWVTAGILAISVLALLTHMRNRDYASGRVMWQDVVRKRPFNARARNNLATFLFTEGEKDRAMELYRQSLELNPDARAHTDFGHYLCSVGQMLEGMTYFEKALEYDPLYADAHLNLGVLLYRQGWTEEALAHYRKVVEIEPKYGAAYQNIGGVLADQGRFGEAVPYYEKAIEVGFSGADVYHQLGIAYAMCGRAEEALRNLRQALRLSPGNETVQEQIAQIETQQREQGSLPSAP